MLSLLGWVFAWIAQFRNALYDRGWLERHQLERPVISVGNLTVGGTGKTPIISYILHWFDQQDIKVGVVSRGYKGKFTGVGRVQLDNGVFYGDEPMMLATQFPEVPIYVCPNRVEAAKELIKNHQVDVILADDGFQHRKLKRDLDVVVLDLMEPLVNYRPLPVGRAREPLSSLKRAQILVYNKVNLASPGQLDKLEGLVRDQQGPANDRWVFSEYYINSLVTSTGEVLKQDDHLRLLLVSGIGRPASFKESLVQLGYKNFVGHRVYPDHHAYTEKDVKALLQELNFKQADYLVTTEKDAIKLNQFKILEGRLLVTKLDIKLTQGQEGFHEQLLRTARSGTA